MPRLALISGSGLSEPGRLSGADAELAVVALGISIGRNLVEVDDVVSFDVDAPSIWKQRFRNLSPRC